MIGVNFQPGAANGEQASPKPQGQQGVQEAIKVLSLRLPKVVGAQAGAPQALLQGTGSGGSRVDSVVNQVMSRIMPQGQPSQPPMANLSGPSFSGDARPTYQPQQMPQWTPPQGFNPRVVLPSPVPQGDFTIGPDGRPTGPPAGSIVEPAPPVNFPLPSAPQDPFEEFRRLLGTPTYPSGPADRQPDYEI